MSTLEERLEEAAKIEDRLKQVELVNQTFTIHAVREVESKDMEGNPKMSVVGTISFDNGDQVEAWLDGARVRPQLHVLTEENAYPVKVKLVKDGQAYKLILIAKLPPVTAVNGAEPAPATVKMGSQTPQERAQTIFDAVVLSKTDVEMLEIVDGFTDFVAYDAKTGILTLDAAKLDVPSAVKLIGKMSK